MITVKIFDREYRVPNNYSELTNEQFGKLAGLTDPMEQLKVFIDDPALNAVTILDELYTECFSYLGQLPELMELPSEIQIGQETIVFDKDVSTIKTMSVFQMDRLMKADMSLPEQLITSSAIILQQFTTDKQDAKTANGLKQYTKDLSVLLSYSLRQWYITELPKLYEGHPISKLTAEEKQANPKQLERYGMWGSLYQLADNDLEKLSYIWQRPIGEVVMAQGYNTAQEQYQRRYAQIMRDKK